MSILGTILLVFSIIGAIIGFIPFFGWLNWFVVPVALLSVLINAIAKKQSALIASIVIIIISIARLVLGGGVL